MLLNWIYYAFFLMFWLDFIWIIVFQEAVVLVFAPKRSNCRHNIIAVDGHMRF